MDIKELIERVTLTPREMQTVIYSIPAREPGEDYSRLMEATVEAQLSKVLNDHDLYVIDRDEMVATGSVVIGTESEREYWLAGFKARGDICRKTYIPLREAIKEAN